MNKISPLFRDKNISELTATGKILVVIYIFFALWLFFIVYGYFAPRTDGIIGFITSGIIISWLTIPIKKRIFARYTFSAQKEALDQKANKFKDLRK